MAMVSSAARGAVLCLALSGTAALAVEAVPAGTATTKNDWWGAPGARADDTTYRHVGTRADDKGFYVGADFMYLTADAKPGYPDSFMGGNVFAGYRFTKYVAVELSYGRTSKTKERDELFAGLSIENKVTLQQAAVDVMGTLPVHERISLIGGAGYGWIAEEHDVEIFDETLADSGDSSGQMFRLTGGVEAKITPELSLRTTARYTMPDVDILDNFWSYNVGLQYSF